MSKKLKQFKVRDYFNYYILHERSTRVKQVFKSGAILELEDINQHNQANKLISLCDCPDDDDDCDCKKTEAINLADSKEPKKLADGLDSSLLSAPTEPSKGNSSPEGETTAEPKEAPLIDDANASEDAEKTQALDSAKKKLMAKTLGKKKKGKGN